MSLPSAYRTPREYFAAAIEFLRAHAWMYQHANTCFLKAGVLDEFPQAFVDYFVDVGNAELNRFPFVHEPESVGVGAQAGPVADFRQQLRALIPAAAFDEAEQCLPPLTLAVAVAPSTSHLRKVSRKKQHEIARLAAVVHAHCADCPVLVDLGAGLGYLSEVLYARNPSVRILGVEADEYRVAAARKRQQDNLPHARTAIRYQRAFIGEQSDSFIAAGIQELHQLNATPAAATMATKATAPLRAAIIGLHACADLTVTSMRLFLRMPQIGKLVIMPCCYHKLELDATCPPPHAPYTFRNFPLSEALKAVVDRSPETTRRLLNRPFLRLACQQTTARWRACSAHEHEAHAAAMLQRAVADAIVADTELVVKVRGKLHMTAAEMATYAGLCRQYAVKSKDHPDANDDDDAAGGSAGGGWRAQHELNFQQIMGRHRHGSRLAEGLTCLQTAMQKLCENIVLYDRLCYMEEYARGHGVRVQARYRKILNEELSPRCYALIAEKL